ncbi:MAG: hypothetical protein C4617_04365 [Candidatus Liberibacter europaeus]|uniref:Uncharacterized protein n=1 Tax=Candidatus Liberibacter europaeus TaxID=744859 RepID=A0A2T4VX09_9HYPH|nr:hypothetical protein [Candidatus Liberibacter europaeus]PTL86300.1 MAG: hypothetical protein C4617_04365 [Candidatus Liberibacter europaeus]
MLIMRNFILIIAFVDSIILWYRHKSNIDFAVDLLMNLVLVVLIMLCKPVSGIRRFVLFSIYLIIILRFMMLFINKYIF